VSQDLHHVGMSRAVRQTGKRISDNLVFRGIFAKGIELFQSYVSVAEAQQEKLCNAPKHLYIDYVRHLKTSMFDRFSPIQLVN